MGQVGTVEQWWALYSHMVRLQDIPAHRDIHLFKKGIKPMWEDAANKKGGKWVRLCLFNDIFEFNGAFVHLRSINSTNRNVYIAPTTKF